MTDRVCGKTPSHFLHRCVTFTCKGFLGFFACSLCKHGVGASAEMWDGLEVGGENEMLFDEFWMTRGWVHCVNLCSGGELLLWGCCWGSCAHQWIWQKHSAPVSRQRLLCRSALWVSAFSSFFSMTWCMFICRLLSSQYFSSSITWYYAKRTNKRGACALPSEGTLLLSLQFVMTCF